MDELIWVKLDTGAV